jgi:hypothetical protein
MLYISVNITENYIITLSIYGFTLCQAFQWRIKEGYDVVTTLFSAWFTTFNKERAILPLYEFITFIKMMVRFVQLLVQDRMSKTPSRDV